MSICFCCRSRLSCPLSRASCVQLSTEEGLVAAFKASALGAESPKEDFTAFRQPDHLDRVAKVQQSVLARAPGQHLTTRKASPTHQINVRE